MPSTLVSTGAVWRNCSRLAYMSRDRGVRDEMSPRRDLGPVQVIGILVDAVLENVVSSCLSCGRRWVGTRACVASLPGRPSRARVFARQFAHPSPCPQGAGVCRFGPKPRNAALLSPASSFQRVLGQLCELREVGMGD